MDSVIGHVFQNFKTWINFPRIGPHVEQRPVLALFVGTFLVTGFLPLLTYFFLTCAAASVSVFLLVLLGSGIVTMVTATLVVLLAIPVCIASVFFLCACALYFAASQMKILVNDAEGLLKTKSCQGSISSKSIRIESEKNFCNQ